MADKKVTGSLRLNSVPIRAYVLIDPVAGFRLKIQFNDAVQFDAGDTMEVDVQADITNPGKPLQFEVKSIKDVIVIQQKQSIDAG